MKKLALALFALCACGRQPPSSVLLVSGDKTSVEDAREFTLLLLDENGAPMSNQVVEWRVSGDGNHVIPYSQNTDENGFAKAWFSTMVAQPKTVRVRSGGVTLEEQFVVTPGKAGWYSSVATDVQCGKADAATPIILIAHARDLYGNPAPGAIVTFKPGSLSMHLLWAQPISDSTGTALAAAISDQAGELPLTVTIDGKTVIRNVCFR